MDGIKSALGRAVAATGTLVGVDDVRLTQVAHDGTAGAVALAGTAALAFLGVNLVGQHREKFLAANLIDIIVEHSVKRYVQRRVPVLDIINQLVGSALDIEQAVYLFAINDMGLNDFLDILGLDLNIGGVVGHDPDDGPFGTKAETACSNHIDTAPQVMVTDSVDKLVNDLEAPHAVA